MIIVIIVLVVIIILAIFFQKKKSSTSSPSISPLKPPSFKNWSDSLNHTAQLYTMKEYCNLKGYDYSPPDKSEVGEYGKCVYNEKTCKADSNPHWVMCSLNSNGNYTDNSGKPCDVNQMPYLEWHKDADGNGRCLVSNFAAGFIQNVCEAQGLGEWHQGESVCDKDGYCNINPNDIPTCVLTPDYCDTMGMDYSSKGTNGTGDCTMNDAQHIVEGLFGRTITRTIKRNGEAMVRQCRHEPLSANCALGVGNFLNTGNQIVINTVDKELQGYMDNLKVSCSGNIYQNFDSFAKCGASLFPQFYLSKQVVAFTDRVLDGMIGWIPGVPHAMIEKGLGYIGKYGEVAVKALYHAGEDAIHAFDIAGDYTERALKNIGLGAEGRIFGGAIKNIIKFGIGMAKTIASVAQESIHIFAESIAPAVYHVFHSVTEAVLHPKEFFNHVGKDIQKFIRDPIGSLKDAFSEISKISSKIFHAVRMVVNYLKDVALKVLGELKDILLDIAKHIEKVFKDVGNDIADVAKGAWKKFKHLF